ncbi:MAG: hypothetical protein K6D97_04045 [Clostridia bacterium]|nr:hypothetical protein [Clostridia bacterium]
MAKRKGARKNRKIKFSEKNYIEKNYFYRKRAVIPVKLDKIEDLYMKHDYKMMELSNSVCDYIEEIAYMVPVNTDIVLEIHCPRVNAEYQNKIKKNIKNNYGIEIDDTDYDLSVNNRQSMIMFLVGIVILILNVFLESYLTGVIGKIFPYFVSVIWWVAIWDMIEIQFMENREIKWKRLNYQQLYDSTITFVFDDEESNQEKEN